MKIYKYSMGFSYQISIQYIVHVIAFPIHVCLGYLLEQTCFSAIMLL